MNFLTRIKEKIMGRSGLQCVHCWVEVEAIEEGKRTAGRGETPKYKHVAGNPMSCNRMLFEDDVEPLETPED